MEYTGTGLPVRLCRWVAGATVSLFAALRIASRLLGFGHSTEPFEVLLFYLSTSSISTGAPTEGDAPAVARRMVVRNRPGEATKATAYPSWTEPLSSASGFEIAPFRLASSMRRRELTMGSERGCSFKRRRSLRFLIELKSLSGRVETGLKALPRPGCITGQTRHCGIREKLSALRQSPSLP